MSTLETMVTRDALLSLRQQRFIPVLNDCTVGQCDTDFNEIGPMKIVHSKNHPEETGCHFLRDAAAVFKYILFIYSFYRLVHYTFIFIHLYFGGWQQKSQ